MAGSVVGGCAAAHEVARRGAETGPGSPRRRRFPCALGIAAAMLAAAAHHGRRPRRDRGTDRRRCRGSQAHGLRGGDRLVAHLPVRPDAAVLERVLDRWPIVA